MCIMYRTGRENLISWRRWWLLYPLLLVMLVLMVSPAAAQVARPDIVLEIRPDTIVLRGEQTHTVTIIARNHSELPATNLSLLTQTDLPVSVSNAVTTETMLPAGGSAVWTVTVRPDTLRPINGKVFFRLDYSWDTSDDTVVAGVALGELTVTAPPRPKIEDVAAFTIESALTNLSEQQPGNVYLIVENKHTEPLVISQLSVETPPFVQAALPQAILPLTVTAGTKATIPVMVTATDQVQPGKTLVLFAADLHWEDQGQRYQGTLVTTHEAEVGVFGEAQILAVLGVPALLLLPGFLIIMTVRIFWGIGKTKEEKEAFIKVASSEFWVLATLLSLLVALAYPFLTQTFLERRRDFRFGYGLNDIYYLYLGSVLIGTLIIVSFYLAKGTAWAYRWVVDKYVADRTPAKKDGPEMIMEKLKRQRKTLKCSRVKLKHEGEIYGPAFILQAGSEAARDYWVAPMILIDHDGLDDEREEMLYDLLNEGDDIEALLALTPAVRFRWAKTLPLPGPQLVAETQLEFENHKGVMVGFLEDEAIQ